MRDCRAAGMKQLEAEKIELPLILFPAEKGPATSRENDLSDPAVKTLAWVLRGGGYHHSVE